MVLTKKLLIAAFFTAILSLAAPGNLFGQTSPGYYRIVDQPGELTKKINLWGFINRPGRYEVPLSTNLIQLITYAGGPREYAEMDNIKVYRVLDNGKRKIVKVDLDDPAEASEEALNLFNEDTIVIEYSAVVSWREVFGLISGPLAMLASIALIVDRLVK